MHNRFESRQGGGIGQYARAEPDTIDLAARGGAWKRGLDRRHRLPFIQPMHGSIGIVHGHPFFSKEPRGGRLAHRERAGETEHDHYASQASRRKKRSKAMSGRPRMVK